MFRSDFPELVEKLKGYGAYMVIDDSYVNKHEFKELIADLPKPKLALNCVGGDTATQMTRLLAYVPPFFYLDLYCTRLILFYYLLELITTNY